MRFFFILFAALLAVPVLWPQVDLILSGFFYRPGDGFYLADYVVFVALHDLAYYGARVLGVCFFLFAVVAYIKCCSIGALDSKAWLYLLLALIIAPGLIANAGFKDHWGRARPREVTEFGGVSPFSPALIPQSDAKPNSSFVSGDGAFGFFLPAFAFVVPRRAARFFFWGMMGAGGLFSFARLVMGAHFYSDITFAAAFMLTGVSAVYACMYGRNETIARWRSFFNGPSNV